MPKPEEGKKIPKLLDALLVLSNEWEAKSGSSAVQSGLYRLYQVLSDELEFLRDIEPKVRFYKSLLNEKLKLTRDARLNIIRDEWVMIEADYSGMVSRKVLLQAEQRRTRVRTMLEVPRSHLAREIEGSVHSLAGYYEDLLVALDEFKSYYDMQSKELQRGRKTNYEKNVLQMIHRLELAHSAAVDALSSWAEIARCVLRRYVHG